MPTLLIVMLSALAVAALIIMGLIYWGKKQDHLGEMTHFCLKYLIQSDDKMERAKMATALGGANDAAALLVLFDVALDEEEEEGVRKAAREALSEMAAKNRKFKDVVADFEAAADERNFPSVIGVLVANFEYGKESYAQSAYVIARQYLRLELYADAWEWLEKADIRNRRANLYGNQIKQLIKLCTTRLIEEADDSFKNAQYQRAKEQYAVLDHGLDQADMQAKSMYLRSACIFVKLKDYRNADQSLLLALAKNHGTELALTLAPLLRQILELIDGKTGSDKERQALEAAIDRRASEIMNILLAG